MNTGVYNVFVFGLHLVGTPWHKVNLISKPTDYIKGNASLSRTLMSIYNTHAQQIIDIVSNSLHYHNLPAIFLLGGRYIHWIKTAYERSAPETYVSE